MDPIDAQLAAYNAQDIDAFAACYAVNAVILDGEGNITCRGRDELWSSYAALFAKYPGQRAEVVSRARAGDWTVDCERVYRGGQIVDALVVYRTREALIDRVTIFR